jgi:hypothetical protein
MERFGRDGEAHDPIEVARAGDCFADPAERLAGFFSALDGRDEAEVTVRGMEVVVAAEDAEDGHAQRLDGLAEHRLVGRGTDAVQDDAGYP